MRNPFWPSKLGNVVRYRAQREVDNLARIRRDVGRRGVYKTDGEQSHRAGPSGRRHDADAPGRSCLVAKASDRLRIERPQRIGGGAGIVAGSKGAVLVTP